MPRNDPISNFIRRYLTRSVVGVSVGLAGLASANAGQAADQAKDEAIGEKAAVGSFGERLSQIRTAASDVTGENREPRIQFAQVTNWGSWSNYGQDAWEDATTVASKRDSMTASRKGWS
jgi:hypothetical protein